MVVFDVFARKLYVISIEMIDAVEMAVLEDDAVSLSVK